MPPQQPLPRRRAPARRCCCSTATRSPTAPSSPFRWRTSPPPPGSRRTRSTASPACSSTCCATSARRTWASPSTCRGRRGAARSTWSTRPTAPAPPEFTGQVDLIKEVLAALRIPSMVAENYEADDIIATLTTRATAEGMQVRICTGDRDALQLVSDEVTVLYPRAVLRAHPVHARGDARQVRPHAGAVPRLRGPARRPLRQPARHPRRGREDRRQVDPRLRQPHRARGPRRRDPRQDRRRPPRSPAPRADQPAAHRAHPGGAVDVDPLATCRRSPTTGRPCTGSSTTSSSGCCASGCWRSSSRPTRPAPKASRSRARGSLLGPCGRGLTSTPTSPGSGSSCAAAGPRTVGTCTGWRSRRRTARPRSSTSRPSVPTTTSRSPPGSPTPPRPRPGMTSRRPSTR